MYVWIGFVRGDACAKGYGVCNFDAFVLAFVVCLCAYSCILGFWGPENESYMYVCMHVCMVKGGEIGLHRGCLLLQ